MSPSLMALLPLDLACHQSSSLSQYLSSMDSSGVELLGTTARTVWVRPKSRAAALIQSTEGGERLMASVRLDEEPCKRLWDRWIQWLEHWLYWDGCSWERLAK